MGTQPPRFKKIIPQGNPNSITTEYQENQIRFLPLAARLPEDQKKQTWDENAGSATHSGSIRRTNHAVVLIMRGGRGPDDGSHHENPIAQL